MRRRFAAVIVLAAFVAGHAVIAQSQSSASASVIQKFLGTWKEDVSKRQISSDPNLVFRRSAGGGLEELRGSELNPLVQPVNFTGKPYAIDESKNTIAWKQIDPRTFERTLYNNGTLITTRHIRLSADEQTLTQETQTAVPERRLNTVVFQRLSGDKGLVGRWRPTSTKTDTAATSKYEAAGPNGFKVTAPNGLTHTVMLDNKPVALTGPAVISGTMTAYRAVDGSTIEVTNSRNGVTTGKSTRKISADGKTMTVTTIQLGPNASKEPSVNVFVKQ